jgi:hypothetical protein
MAQRGVVKLKILEAPNYFSDVMNLIAIRCIGRSVLPGQVASDKLGSMCRSNKWIVATVVVAVAVVVSVVGGCELWARSWEQRWADFKAHWEAQGEVFDMSAHLPPVVDDALNFAKHPWVAAVASQKPAVLERLSRMSPDEIPGYTDWLYAEKLVPMPEDLAQRVAAHCEPFAADFVALAEAADRPHCRVELKFDDGFHMPPIWLGKVSPCGKVIAAHAAAALAMGDEDTFTSQLVVLLKLGNHMHSTNILLGAVVGCGIEHAAYLQITALAPEGLKKDGNRARLIEAIDGRSRPLGEEMAKVFRFERAMALDILAQIEAGRATFPTIGSIAVTARRRVFLARNRLALCEESQHELLAPGGRLITVLNLETMTRYDELTRQRFKKPSEFEAIAAGQRFATGGVAAGLWRSEEDRQPARTALKEWK